VVFGSTEQPLRLFVVVCRFVFASTSFGHSVAVYRRRQDNTLEKSQVQVTPYCFKMEYAVCQEHGTNE